MNYSINDSLSYVFTTARGFARENYNDSLCPAHLLRALLHPEAGLHTFLETANIDIPYLIEWAEVRIDELPKCSTLPETINNNEGINATMEEAERIKIHQGFIDISPLCLLASICRTGVAFSREQLKSFPLKESDFLFAGTETHDQQFDADQIATNSSARKALEKYCIDKTQLALEEKLDPITGRELEIRQMVEILARRTKPNVMIIGEPGVGKTALVNGFAQAIIQQQVPAFLTNTIALELNQGILCAGASYKGEIEDRMQKIIHELKELHNVILFIDEIHILLDSKGPMGTGIGTLLKPLLANGELTLIGTTTPDEYRKLIEPDKAFCRRFELLTVHEPDIPTAAKMIELLVPYYEGHHKLGIDKKTIPECIRLAKRYIKDKRLPDSALDLLDRTMAAVRTSVETIKETHRFKTLFEQIRDNGDLPEEDKLNELKWLQQKFFNTVNLPAGRLSPDLTEAASSSYQGMAAFLQQVFDGTMATADHKKEMISTQDLAATVALKTGIPVGKIQAEEKEKLLNMHAFLKKRMVGQDHALKAISEAVIESRSGLNKAGQPIGSFFFLGPTGTGKTELAKSIAEFLFNDEKAMIRFDMSEFKEEHSAALLYGAPPGYVGYEEGGLLVNKIRQQPYSVVLFDEIEKAHQSVFDVFLQIMDEGHIHDKQGKEGDFSNALIIFTSNIGSDFIVEQFNANHIPTHNDLLDKMTPFFKPEFLGRITEIVPFSSITEDMALHIFNLQLQSLQQVLHQQKISISLSDTVRLQLVSSGFSTTYGARPISGIIRQQIRRPISKMLVKGELCEGSHVTLNVNEKNEIQWSTKQMKASAG